MAYDIVTEKDAAGTARNIAGRLVDAGAAWAQAVTLNQAGADVGTGNPLFVQGAQLASILAGLITSGATSQAKKIDDPAGATDIIVPGGYVRKDTLAAVTPAVGDWMPALGGPYGEGWMSLATALGADVDSVLQMPVPGVNAFVNKNADYASAATAALWTPAAGKVFVATSIHIDWSGSTDGVITLWSSTSSAGDTTFTSGTDRLIWKFSAQPSTKGSGGFSRAGFWVGGGIIYPLNVTRSTGITCTVSVGGYEIVP